MEKHGYLILEFYVIFFFYFIRIFSFFYVIFFFLIASTSFHFCYGKQRIHTLWAYWRRNDDTNWWMLCSSQKFGFSNENSSILHKRGSYCTLSLWFLNTLIINKPTITSSFCYYFLQVYIDNDGIGQWKICFKAVGVHLPTGYHFGISASTSDKTGNTMFENENLLKVDRI